MHWGGGLGGQGFTHSWQLLRTPPRGAAPGSEGPLQPSPAASAAQPHPWRSPPHFAQRDPGACGGGAPQAPPRPRPRAPGSRAPGLQAALEASRPAPPRVTSAPPPRAPAPPPTPCPQLLCHFLIPASCFPEVGIRSRPRPVPQPLAPPVSAAGWGRRQGAGGTTGAEPRGSGRGWVAGPRSPSPPRSPTLSPNSPWPPTLPPPGPGSLEVGLLVHLGPRSEAALGCSAAGSGVPTPAQSCQAPELAWGSLHIPACTAHSLGL